jgi:CDP-glucose 4,6-dehydratase
MDGLSPHAPRPGSTSAARGFWRGRAVLVTGATGFLGSVLLLALVAAGADVTYLMRGGARATPLLRRATRARGTTCDIRDGQAIADVLHARGVQTVFHLAAQTIVGVANRSPAETLDVNVRGTWTLLEACRAAATVGQVVVASSDKAYGDHPRLPYREDAPLLGRHPYDVSKSCTDLIAAAYAKTYGMNVAVTRCGNFYGGGDLNWNRIVPGTIASVLRGARPVVRSDGKNVRDYLYVEDAADAYLTLAAAMSARDDLRGEAFNFSGNNRLSVLELVARTLALMGSDLVPDVRDEASNEIRDQYLDGAKAYERLAWAPRHTLDQGLQKTIDWYRGYHAEAGDASPTHA